MPLTTAQQQAFKADVLADPALNTLPPNSDSAFQIADTYKALANPDFLVWRTNVDPQEIFDTLNWSLYTPSDAPDSTATYTNRLLVIQTKQMNLQNMLIGRAQIDCSKPNIRAGLRDAVIQIPSGASGANTAPGGSNGATMLAACIRKANRLEKLLSTGPATTGATTANVMGFEGTLSYPEVLQAMGW